MATRTDEQMTSAPGSVEYSYGSARLQTLDYWKADKASAPLILFIHGGGWKRGDKQAATGATKVAHWHGSGYAVASINYRLVPDATIEEQAMDVAHAVGWLRDQARNLGFDPNRIILIGHSAGAHLAALVSTDLRWFKHAGVPTAAIRGTILLDGAAYDVPAQMKDGPTLMHPTYEAAFGTDAARQRALSPTYQATAPNAGDFLILHVERNDGTRQSNALAAALRKGGNRATVQGFEGKGLRGHMTINRLLGSPDYPATAIVDKWIAAHF